MSDRSATKISKGSEKLSKDENGLVFYLIGSKCVSLCTTIAQVFITKSSESKWIKKATGVLCFIKDNERKSYYFQLICLKNHKVLWEEEMYDDMEIFKTKSYLLTFEGQYGMVALNFAFKDEADTFLIIAMSIVVNRNRRRKEKFALSSTPNAKNSKKGKKVKKKISKDDIGLPSNFKHVTHVGWKNGDESITQQSQPNHGENMRITPTAAPLLPPKNSTVSKSRIERSVTPTIPQTPPPNARKRGPAPTATYTNPHKQNVPLPPPPAPPIHTIPPPPPPSLLPVAKLSNDKPKQVPVVDDGRSALLDSIRKGSSLKKVSSTQSTREFERSPDKNRPLGKERGANSSVLDAVNEAINSKRPAFELSSESEDGEENNVDDSDDWDD